MDIGAIDQSATLGRSWLHAASPIAKLVAFAAILAAVVVTWNVLVIAALLIALSAVVVSARLKPGLAFGLATYPVVFAAVFAFASAPDLVTAASIVLKAMTAALAAVTVVLTTPYPYVFAPVQRVVPVVVGDALLMTYRTTFLLLEKFSDLFRAARLRSGLTAGHPARSARASVRALGGLLLYSFDLALRDYDIMRLRGYSGRLRARIPRSTSRLRDAALVTAALLALATSVLCRVSSAELNPYSWLPALVAVLMLPIAFVWRGRAS